MNLAGSCGWLALGAQVGGEGRGGEGEGRGDLNSGFGDILCEIVSKGPWCGSFFFFFSPWCGS